VLITVLDGHTREISHTAFSPDGSRIVTASDDGTARLWDTAGAQLTVLRGHEAAVLHTAFSPDGRRLITTSKDHTARLWDATGVQIAVLYGHEAAVLYATFSYNSTRVVTASADGTARLWDTVTGAQVAVLSGHAGPLFVAAFSPDSSRIITGSGGSGMRIGSGVIHTAYTAHLWDTDSGTQLAILPGHIGSVTHAAFSPDGGRVVTGSFDSGTRLWDATDGTLIAFLGEKLCPTGGHGVQLTTFSPDGRRIITAWQNGTVHLWDTLSNTRLAMLHSYQITRNLAPCLVSHPSPYPEVVAAALSGDNRRLITAAEDGTARLLRLFPTTQALIDHARQLVPRQLTDNERKQFFLDLASPRHN
jgi:WD40 repeat protein